MPRKRTDPALPASASTSTMSATGNTRLATTPTPLTLDTLEISSSSPTLVRAVKRKIAPTSLVDQTDEPRSKPKRARKWIPVASNEKGGTSFFSSSAMLEGPTRVIKTAAERLPTEVWHMVMNYLPTSHVVPLASVSRTLLRDCLLWPCWRTICEENKLGEPKRKYKSYMALVCSESCYMCDRCDLRSTGTGLFKREEIPLRIGNMSDQGHVWQLCRDCRLDYYAVYPETEFLNRVGTSGVTLSWIRDHLHLKQKDLRGVDFYYEQPDLEERYDWETDEEAYYRLERAASTLGTLKYPKNQVYWVALKKYGGTVGLCAVQRKFALDVLKAYKRRKYPIRAAAIDAERMIEQALITYGPSYHEQ